MRDLILNALNVAVSEIPQLKEYLSDDARLIASIYEHKVGEAPDDDVRRKDERKIQRAINEYFDEQYKRIVREIKREFDSKSVYQMSFWSEEEKRLWEKLSGVFINIILHGVEGGLALLPEGLDGLISTTSLQSAIVDAALSYRQQWIKGINDNTMKQVWKEIDAWQQSGDPLPTLINILETKKDFLFGKTRAERVAVTETTRLHALGNEITFKESGYIKQWNWMTAQDELVCPVCRAGFENSPYPISVLHEKLPAHVNCRCWSQPIIDLDAINQQREELWAGVSFD